MTGARCGAAWAAAALAAVIGGASVRAQQAIEGAQAVFRSGIELVRVDALVVRDGEVVKGLQPADFEVRDNGVRQEVVSASLEQIPIEALFVFDVSGSVSEANARLLRGAAWLFLDGLAPQDRAGLVTFNARPSLVQPLAGRLDPVRTALASIAGGGSTALNDAVYAALRCRERGETRAAIVVFTDGVDNISWLSAEEVIEAAKRSDVIVHTVVVGAPRPSRTAGWIHDQAVEPADNPLLHGLGIETGGRVWSASWPELAGAFRAVLDDLRSRYLLTYYPSGVAGSGWHALDVRLTRSGARVTARAGYYRSLSASGR